MDTFVYLLAVAVCFANANPLNAEADRPTRIINGYDAAENQFLYAVSIQQLGTAQQQSPTRGHQCGGVLITLQHVLTAATCLYESNAVGNPVLINPSQYRVFAGANLLANDTLPDRIRMIANFTIHPQFIAGPAHINDIAVVTLVAPFPNTAVSTLPLPAATYNPNDAVACTVAGWGASVNVVNTNATTQLKFSNKYIYNQTVCTFVHNSQAGSANIFETMICAASLDIVTNSCNGDTGNGLVCGGILTGILFQHNNCQATSYPELFTRVNNYTTWIQTVSSAPTFSSGLLTLFLGTILQYVTIRIVS